MTPRAYITTSWDDGHPLDLRVADLLARHGLPGTFYIPRSNPEHPTMSPAQVRQLATSFEIGAHTLDHVPLTSLPAAEACLQIEGSRQWVCDTTGRPCPMFCPPRGHFTRHHLPLIRAAGFTAIRTVELLSLARPRRVCGLLVMPTTLQAHPHPWSAYARNALRRCSLGNLLRSIRYARHADWPATAAALLERTLATGGVFHLWGHSWEIDQTAQWPQFEQVLSLMADAAKHATAACNSVLCAP